MSFITNLFESTYEKEIENLISPEKNLQGTINTEHLEQADLLKSTKTNPKVFVTTLVKVIKRTTNGNIIINILTLLDTCIKNAGQGFYIELNTITLIEQFQRIMREFDVNVRNKAKEHIQNWALLFKNNTEMFMFVDLYENLKRMGVEFPSVTIPISSALVETKLAPPWSDSDNCNRCRTQFTTFNRKHHCRNCGKVFCQDCSSKNIPLPALGLTDAVRVCDTCHYKITTGNASSIVANSPINNNSNSLMKNNAEDDDLQRAIEASLKVSGSNNSQYQNQRSTLNEKSVKFAEPAPKSNEDDELERAIKESLLEAERVKTKPKTTTFTNPEPSPYESTRFSSNPEQASYTRQQSLSEPAPTLLTAKPSYDLTPTQLSNISLFATLVQTQSHEIASKGYESFNPHHLQTLFAQVASLHSQLTSCVQEAAEGYKELYDMNELLNEVIGVYDGYNHQKMLYAGKSQNGYSSGNSAGNAVGYPPQTGYPQGHPPQGVPSGAYATSTNIPVGYQPQQNTPPSQTQGYPQEPVRQQSYSSQGPAQGTPYSPPLQQNVNAPQGYAQDTGRQQSYQSQAPTQGSPFSPPVQSFPSQQSFQGPHQSPPPVQQHYSPQQIPGQPQVYPPGQGQYPGQPSQPPGFGISNQVLVPKVVPEAPQDAPLIDLK